MTDYLHNNNITKRIVYYGDQKNLGYYTVIRFHFFDIRVYEKIIR